MLSSSPTMAILPKRPCHPSYETFKTYEADLSGTPSRAKLQRLEQGILLEGKPTAPARVKILSQKKHSTKVAITIHEGRKHQVKKMFAAIGHPVNHLKRIAYGKLELQTLATGQFKRLSPTEINLIFAKKS
ncbi:probable ribosomal large subunit pseudouridine synthase B [Desulfotalea psychrophila LSv54]|uniref:Probable ribosomal large subunit pseudouridine synthase B n=1 Tax=Desulfotalea psychrophila (strain LSv54 / DSM 12343) TaxID=177439 RepID=Q6AQ25_DESPS|nr:probable ribosomal large subunit pseudouridine synthase B [Desulfotalea psychrophila LSv54]